MEIVLRGIGKKFAREWIFSKLDWTFRTGQACAIVGPNGSGKSTLLQIISGAVPPTKGTITYQPASKPIASDEVFREVAYAAPYLELIEELTLEESLRFHFKFKEMREPLSLKELADKMLLGHAFKKPVQDFSSGMKQRLKLGLAFYSKASVLLLDEPTSNLDKQGIAWYQAHILPLLNETCVLIGSNQDYEYEFCTAHLQIEDWKKKKRFFK